MYVRPQHAFGGGSAVMRQFTACAAWTATPAPFPMLRPAVTVWTRCCHILKSNQSAQGGTNSDTTSSLGHPPPPQPHSLLAMDDALMGIVSELLRHVGTTLDERPLNGKESERCSSFIKGIGKGASTFDVSEGFRSLISKKSNKAALTITSVEGVLIVFVHPSIAEVDSSRAPSIQKIPAPPSPPGVSAQPPWLSYGVPNFTADKQDVIKAFQFALNGGHEPPHDLIAKFPNDRKLGVFTSDGRTVTVYVAAYESDWAHFNSRQCDFLHSGMSTLAKTIPEGGRSSVGSSMQSVFYDYAVDPPAPPAPDRLTKEHAAPVAGANDTAAAPSAPTPTSARHPTSNGPPLIRQAALHEPLAAVQERVAPTATTTATTESKPRCDPVPFIVNANVVQLFCGESGIGKTIMMLVGRCEVVDLAVYVIANDKDDIRTWNADTVKRLGLCGPDIDEVAERRSLLKILAKVHSSRAPAAFFQADPRRSMRRAASLCGSFVRRWRTPFKKFAVARTSSAFLSVTGMVHIRPPNVISNAPS